MRFLLPLILTAACAGSTPTLTDGGTDDAPSAVAPTTHDATTDGPVAPSVTAACEALANAVCAKLGQCSPFALELAYGDAATCKSRTALGCTVGYPSSSLTTERASSCAATVPSLDCSQFLRGDLGDSCNAQPGSLGEGSACIDDAQCASTFCAKGLADQCGKCAKATNEGDACVNSTCSRGTVCSDATKKCVEAVAGKVGASCTGQEGCDSAHAVGCNTLSGKCIALELAATGKACGADSIAPSKFTLCRATGTCSAILSGTCSAAVLEGGACGSGTAGPYCLGPAKCVSGICTLPSPSSCR